MTAQSVLTAVWERLAGDASLDSLLARSAVADGPAIYTAWGTADTRMPYVVLTWAARAGYHWGKRVAQLTVDIWTAGPSSVLAEAIKNRIIELLDRQELQAGEAGAVRPYLDADGSLPDEPGVVRWTIGFEVQWWRKGFMTKLA